MCHVFKARPNSYLAVSIFHQTSYCLSEQRPRIVCLFMLSTHNYIHVLWLDLPPALFRISLMCRIYIAIQKTNIPFSNWHFLTECQWNPIVFYRVGISYLTPSPFIYTWYTIIILWSCWAFHVYTFTSAVMKSLSQPGNQFQIMTNSTLVAKMNCREMGNESYFSKVFVSLTR